MGERPEAGSEEDGGGDGGDLRTVVLDYGGSVGEFDKASEGGCADGDE